MARKAKPPERKATDITRGGKWTRGFLAALSRNGNVTKSAELVHLDRGFVYRWRNEHPDFATAWDEALQESYDRLEHEARRRAQWGTNKPVFYKGNVVGFEQEFSDTLMLATLKAKRPDEFGDKLTIKVRTEDAAILKAANLKPDEAWAQWIEMLRSAQEADVEHHAD